MQKWFFLTNIWTNVGYKVQGLDMYKHYKPRGDNLIPPFMNFSKQPYSFYNTPVYEWAQAYKMIPGTMARFTYFCSGPFVCFDAIAQEDYCLALDDFFITSKKDPESGENAITFWDKPEVPEQIDYAHTDKPLRVSEPLFFNPLFTFTGLVPKRIEQGNHGKLTCRPRNITDGKSRIENLDDRIAFKLIQQMNFDIISSHTANRFFYPNPKVREGKDTQIIFKVGPTSYQMVILDKDCHGFIKIINYHPEIKKYTEEEGADIKNCKDLAVSFRDIKNMRDEYVKKQYIH